jgi:hypothetical protein
MSQLARSFSFRLMADYHQIFLADDRDPTPFFTEISEEDCRRRLSVAPGLVVFHTARNMSPRDAMRCESFTPV